MRHLPIKRIALCIALLLSIQLNAQEIRYVKMATNGGDNAKDGTSWATAKADIQDAINDLVNNNLTGEVWVAAGTYYPTETTESSGSQYYKAFKIPAGITVRGGFAGTEKFVGADKIADVLAKRNKTKNNLFGDPSTEPGDLDGEPTKAGVYTNKTILSGAVTKKSVGKTWNPKKEQFEFTFYGNSYHVVFFAMNGFDANGRANALTKPAKLEGCIIEGGHAYSNNASDAHPHIAYGGGIYMVANSFVYNCEVRDCDASRNGGGIYMDGGGIVRRTLVHDCQALGLGTEYGLGGGICEDGKTQSKANPIVVAQSAVTNCVGRIGGGMALISNQTDNGKYAIVANSTLVNNNTASTEAGGVYTYHGCGLASMTIVRNKCNGSGIVQNGVATGRAGGVYSRDEAYIGNCVIWGNTCSTSSDVQYASSRTSISSSEKTHFYYNAVSKADNTDWSGATKMGILPLDDLNSTTVAEKGKNGYPLFENPTTKAGYLSTYFTTEGDIATDYNWKVYSESALHHAGINTADLDYEGLTPAPQGKSYDMEFGLFNPRCTMGAFISEMPSLAPNTTQKSGEIHFYVDPNYNFAQHHEGDTGAKGMSWDRPTRFLGNVLEYIKDTKNASVIGSNKVFIHVKEGVVDNTDSYKFGRVRTSTLDVPSNVTILGSYAKSLTGTNLNKRNPVATPTIISGELLDAYKYNVAHLINIKDAENVTIDGFKISYANASSTELANDNKNGAAITITNSTTNIKLKNIIVSNSQAECGAAVYADASTASFENCIFHNNTTTQHNNSGIVYATNNSHLTFDHCDVLRNVGHASYLGSNNTTNVWKNSIFYGNLDRALPDTNSDNDSQVSGYPGRNKYALAAFSGNTANATGDHCMFDYMSEQFKAKFNNNDTGNKWQYDLQYKFADGAGEGYPRFINPTKNSGYSEHGDETYYGRATSFEPHNNNPIVNMAFQSGNYDEWGRDIVETPRTYGGRPDIGAVENHEAQPYDEEGNPVENAYRAGQPAYGAIMFVRDYESDASKPGTHVTTYDKDAGGTLTVNATNKGLYNAQGQFLDGYSWATAINGNAQYDYAPGTIDATTAINTYVKPTVTSSGGTFKGLKLSVNGKYIATSGSTVILTDNETDATVWSVSNSATGAAQQTLTAGNNRYFWVSVNGTRTYLKLTGSGSNGTLSYATGNNNNGFTVATATGGYILSRTVSTRKIYVRTNDDKTALECNTTNTNNVVASTSVSDGSTYKVSETYVDASGNAAGTRIHTIGSNSRVISYKDLHVYNTFAELNSVITATGVDPVTYNIANLGYKSVEQDVPEIDGSGNDTGNTIKGTIDVDAEPTYLAGTSTLSTQADKATSGKYALINAGNAKLNDLVYIYDVNQNKYVSYSSGSFSLATETTNAAWRIKQSAKTGRLNIFPSSVSEDTNGEVASNAEGWSWSESSLSLANRGNTTSQWVFENDLQYEVYNMNTTTSSGTVKINGLQYAVNMANKSLNLVERTATVTEKYGNNTKQVTHTYQDLPTDKQDGQVWVGAGTYSNYSQYTDGSKGYPYDNASKANPTDYTAETGNNPGYGYLVRNHVKVYGGFPAVGNPGMDERHPQLSRGIAMSKANTAAGLNVDTYETILQTNTGKNTSTNKGSVLATPYECAVTMAYDSNTPRNRTVYEGAEWDGFTLQYGWRDGFNIRGKNDDATAGSGTGRRVGGGGACIYENIVLRNCVVRDNSMKNNQQCRGGGVYCDGGILENCYLLMNETNCSTSNFGGGMYMIQGTMFNSVVAGNRLVGSAKPQGAGIFIESAKFYNNTIVNNEGGTAIACYTASKADASLTIYNSIVIAQAGKYAIERTSTATPLELVHCYVKSDQAAPASGLMSLADDGTTTANGTVTVRDNTKSAWGIARERSNKIFFGSNSGVADVTATISDLNKYNPFVLAYDNTNSDGHGANYKYDYRINQKALESGIDFNCVNAATEDIGNAELPDFDMDFTDRIQDCALDIGAYEFNGAYTISPDVTTVSGQAIFYVTPNGSGTSAGNDPANAACAQKLQKILDAAGRYKYNNPGTQVIVKVANSKALQDAKSDFKYYATRTTDYTDQDVRVWAIEVPRGVELWGGYTDVPTKMDNGKVVKDTDHASNWGNTYNGFYSGSTDLRDITGNPTYFDSYYYNKGEKSEANTYHVIKFTDRIYDPEGYAYLLGEESKILAVNALASTYRDLATNDESQFIHMTDAGVTGNVIMDGENPKLINGSYASNRAVIDGIFVTGGAADGSLSSNNSTLNINAFGGAAVVTDYAYVRNCVLENNKATNGGALALTDRALVSGTIIKNNTATEQGGGIYVFEDGAKLSNGYTINSQAPADQPMDYRMAHVITSTIAGNNAQQGGGVWYTEEVNTNVRFNSVAVWDNNASDQANVFGMVNPEQPTDDETNSDVFYPFSYSYIQNIRASGTNNMSVQAANKAGVRFVDPTKDVNTDTPNANAVATGTNYGYYGLTNYSVLNSAGMPVSYYNILKSAIAIADADIMGKQYTADIQGSRKYVEAGARVLGRTFPTKQLMLRLFVAQPEDVDDDLATKFMELTGTQGSAAEYYSQQGSSFAYPFNSLQAALDYIKLMRSTTQTGATVNGEAETYISKYHANNLPFEILVGRGTYYPKESLTGSSNNVWASTYAIPEGVTIMGGFNPQGGGTGSYYGRYYNAKVADAGNMTDGNAGTDGKEGTSDDQIHYITANITPIPTGTTNDRGFKYGTETINQGGINVTFQQWHIMDIGDRRAMSDNNHNGIIEPWEFTNQTIISGNAVNGETDGVYHILSACPDEDAVGILPNASIARTIPDHCDGYTDHEEGQQIRLNGLIVTGGNALTYLNTALDEYGSYNYYLGAGLNVDGNRYKDSYHNKSTSLNFDNTHRAAYGVGYRDIPVSITNCQFRNNIAGYGGAITSNGSLTLFASSFEQNLAVGATEEGPFLDHNGNPIEGLSKIMYPGQGGAIHATHQLSAFNCLFANNEARLAEGEKLELGSVKHSSIRVPNPTIGTVRAAGGAIMMGTAGQHHIVNCDFVKNKANMYPAVFTMNPTYNQNSTDVNTHAYSQIINTVAWQNEVNPEALKAAVGTDYEAFPFASKLMVNVGRKDRGTTGTNGGVKDYVPAFTASDAPVDQAALDGVAIDGKTAYENSVWQEESWFCAYEEGVGFTPNNENDLRGLSYSPLKYSIDMIKAYNNSTYSKNEYQNCNILIVSDNANLAGPNFGKPSVKAGYDGYMESADWSPARVNRLTDNGNGFLHQTSAGFAKWSQVAGGVPTRAYTTETATDYANDGAYPVTHYIKSFPEYKYYMSLGDEKYMETTAENQTETVEINGVTIPRQKNLPRISYDPTPGAELAYIDIGVYEYIKRPLKPAGNEVDILWVSTVEKPENGDADGSSWKQPTSDLQRAIETLLASRNGHKKEVRVMEGEYSPVQTYTKNINGVDKKIQAFVIDTKALNGAVITPEDEQSESAHYAQSITIKGGYSADRQYEYDPAEYETIIRQQDAGGSANTDYLIYIGDPTQRYAFTTYTESSNDFGAKLTEASPVQTMPIQIDGVTLINDKATAGTKGSAIYYPNYTSDVVQPKAVNVGGSVVYYKDKTELNKIEGGKHTGKTSETETDYQLIVGGEPKENPAKLIITKTKIVGSGDPNATTDNGSAVYIGQYGGFALIYNTVFGDNFGKPLEAYNTINVNNTFGQNGGQIVLKSLNYNAKVESADVAINPSMLHNTAMWMNNKGGAQFAMSNATISAGEETLKNLVKVSTEVATLGDVSAENGANLDNIFTYNSFTGGNTLKTSDADLSGNKHNTGLVAENSNIINGPNFVDPNNADIYARNYDIKPSLRLLNKGNGTRTVAVAPATEDTYAGKYFDLVIDNKYDFSLEANTKVDVLTRTRIVSQDAAQRIDIGAYEYQGTLKDILYVDPNKSHSDTATGDNWNEALGYGDLQNAIDLVGLAYVTKADADKTPSYVFVKGNSSTSKDKNMNETIILRDGVQVYGSIISSYTAWHGDDTYKTRTVPEYIKAMSSDREGIASNAASKTIVTGIKTSEYTGFTGDNPALIDGFVVTPVDKEHQPTAPVLDLTNKTEGATIVVRNVIVADNDLSNATGTNVNVAEVSNGLIYEVLMRDNKPKGNGAVLEVRNNKDGETIKTRGYAVNVTVEGKTIGADGTKPVDGGADLDAEKSAQIFKSITNSINSGTGANKAGANAPYGAITNKGISGYFYNIADPNLNYQLTETSKYIDMCDATNPLTSIAHNLAQYINYDTDRDILGNPRYMRNVSNLDKIDRGAFETWRVDKNFYCGSGTNGTNKSLAIAAHFYPHDGSVVYVMGGKTLVIDPLGDDDVKPTPENPGFLLVKEGGNFYGNGRPVTAAYVAIERTIPVQGAVVSVPYAMDYKGHTAVSATDGNGELELKYYGFAFKEVKNYSGSNRSDWKYVFKSTNSNCWENVTSGTKTEASNGVFFLGSDDATSNGTSSNTYRFTSKGANLTDYIYTESGDSKSVVLKKYDDAESTNNGADFTDDLDMSWNCIGLPYLVSEYKPYLGKNGAAYSSGDYMMNIPHTLWLYYDKVGTGEHEGELQSPDGTKVNGEGGYYSVDSWESGAAAWHTTEADARIWVGEGIFTQTATHKTDGEKLKFYLPVAPALGSGSSTKTRNARYFYGEVTDVDDLDISEEFNEGVTVVETQFFTVGGIRIEKPKTGVVIVREILSNGKSRSHKINVKEVR